MDAALDESNQALVATLIKVLFLMINMVCHMTLQIQLQPTAGKHLNMSHAPAVTVATNPFQNLKSATINSSGKPKLAKPTLRWQLDLQEIMTQDGGCQVLCVTHNLAFQQICSSVVQAKCCIASLLRCTPCCTARLLKLWQSDCKAIDLYGVVAAVSLQYCNDCNKCLQ